MHDAAPPSGYALAQRLGSLQEIQPPRADGTAPSQRGGIPSGSTDRPSVPTVGAAAPIFTGHDQAAMAHAVIVDLPRLIARFESELEPILDKLRPIERRAERARIHELARRELRLICGDSMLASTIGLHVVKGA